MVLELRGNTALQFLSLNCFYMYIYIYIGNLGTFTKLRKSTVAFVMSVSLSMCVRMEQFGFTGRIFMISDILAFWKNRSRNFKFHLNLTRITGTLREDRCAVVITTG